MAGGYQDEDDVIANINVTPLVDVTLVLLIIFMVTAKLIVSRGISVEMPKTASGGEVASTLQITIDRERRFFVNGDEYPDRAAARLRVDELRTATPDLKAIVTADKTVPHGEVMKAIDFLMLAGVTKFALTSDPLSGEEPR